MDKYYEQIDFLVQDLLIPARTQNVINKEVFDKFYNILLEIEKEVQGKKRYFQKDCRLAFFYILFFI